MSKDTIIIAGAGAGKTTHIVREAINSEDKSILITTYTQANERAIKAKFIEENGCVPKNVTIQTWFSFLLEDGVRPFQGKRWKDRVGRLILVSGVSALYSKETDTLAHYFSPDGAIYSDKVAKLAIKCDELNNGAVINRLVEIYDKVYVDEVQDIAGHDLDFLKLIAVSSIELVLVGDPRQGTYSTNNSTKNGKVRKDKTKITGFFSDDQQIRADVDATTLNKNYRCHADICELSNGLYPSLPKVDSVQSETVRHQGVFVVKTDQVDDYLDMYKPMQLRWDSKTSVNDLYSVMNFGGSKGLEFDRVLIYTSGPIREWLKTLSADKLKPVSLAKLYVAITRARHSVAFVCDGPVSSGLTTWDRA